MANRKKYRVLDRPLTDEEKKTVESNIGLTHDFQRKHLTQKMRDRFDSECHSTSNLGLMRAVQYHKPEKGKLSTYAYKTMRNEVMCEIWWLTNCRAKDESCKELHDVMTGANFVEETVVARENIEILHKALSIIPKRYELLLKQIFFQGKKKSQIADEAGLSRQAIDFRYKSAIDSLLAAFLLVKRTRHKQNNKRTHGRTAF